MPHHPRRRLGDPPVNLTVSLALNFDQCNESLVLIATVHNVGTVDAPAGVDVTFYEGTDASGLKLGTKPTSEPPRAAAAVLQHSMTTRKTC